MIVMANNEEERQDLKTRLSRDMLHQLNTVPDAVKKIR